MLIAGLLTAVALIWALLVTLQVYEHKRFVCTSLREPLSNWNDFPGVLVCVPCKGLDIDLADNLCCVLTQAYPKYRVRFVVDAESDPATSVIKRLMAEANVPCELLVAGTCTDSGQKVHNLRCATAELPDDVEVLVFFDSDSGPAPDAVARFVNAVCRSGQQVATGYRWLVPRRLTFANLTLASINAAAASLLKHHGWNLIWGGSWAITREVFEETAIANAWQGTLSDDLVASRALRLAGVRIVFEPGCMSASPIDATWKQATSFLRRQFLICRCYAPMWWSITVPLTILQPVMLFGGVASAGRLAWIGSPHWVWPLAISGTLYSLTVLRGHWRQSVWTSRIQGAPAALRTAARFDLWAAPLSCLVAAGGMVLSAVGRSIEWRGIHYYIGPAGRITLLGRMPNDEQRHANQAAHVYRLTDAKRTCSERTASSREVIASTVSAGHGTRPHVDNTLATS